MYTKCNLYLKPHKYKLLSSTVILVIYYNMLLFVFLYFCITTRNRY